MGEIKSKIPRFKKPNWLRVKLPVGQEYKKVRNIVDKYNIQLTFLVMMISETNDVSETNKIKVKVGLIE